MPKAIAPTIPSRKLCKESYSGLPSETVGPAYYEPHYYQNKKLAPKVDFGSLKS